MNSVTKTASRVIVDVASDRMAAHIRLQDASDIAGLTAEEILGALKEAKLVLDEQVTRRATEFIDLVTSGSAPPEQFLLAEGRSAVEPKDEVFVWSDQFQREAEAWQSDAPINYYKISNIATVENDMVIGTLQPAVQGDQGLDVYGTAITPRRTPSEIELDSSVARSADDPNVVVSKMPGRVVYNKGQLSIVEALILQGDIDFETGSIDSSVEVQIAGTVSDGFHVKSAKSISVGGAIEAANVEAQGDVVVRGGILGHRRGKMRAGGEIVAKFCLGANLHAAGDISAHKEVIDSEMYTEGKFLAAQSAVIGGHLYAREGVEVAALGSEAAAPTSIIVGIHPDVLKEAKRLDQDVASRTEAVAKIRQNVQPLLANQKRLTPSQKERATELLYEADVMEEGIASVQKYRDEMLENAQAKNVPSVLVNKIVYSKVSIQLGRRRTVFQADLKGPVRIEERKVENVTEFVAVHQLTGSVTILPSGRIEEAEKQDPASAAEEGSSDHGSGR